MNDDEVLATARASLTAARESLGRVHMERPVAALVARGRARQRRQVLTGGGSRQRRRGRCGAAGHGRPAGSSQAPPVASGGTPGAQTIAYVVKRVENALASNQVFRGTSNSMGQLV